ncbi:GNAT family N-acetyltransferase [Xylanibacillus composti]|nr:GNAT family N-acetyltransferase [Xylanibacillus composti]
MMIHRPTIQDLDLINEIFLECKQDLDYQGIFQWDHVYPHKDVIVKDIINQNMHALTKDGEIVGVITLDTNEEEEYREIYWAYDDCMVIHRLVIRPSHQGKGFAYRLMQYMTCVTKVRTNRFDWTCIAEISEQWSFIRN